MKVRDVIKRIEDDGWYYIGTVGSHRHYKHPTKPGKTTVPGHPSKDVPTGTLAGIWKQSGLPKP
jgi:predicted RNA binding protein YcfA (HicA-like mRNA interferase family)